MASLKMYLLLATAVLAAVFEGSNAQLPTFRTTRQRGPTTRRPDNSKTEDPNNEGQTSTTGRTRAPFAPTLPTLIPNNPTTTTTASPPQTTQSANPNRCCAADEGRSQYCCTATEECFAEQNGNKTCRPAPTTTTTTTEATTSTTTTTTTQAPTTTTTTTTQAPRTTADPEPRCCEAESATGRSRYCCFKNETCVDNRVTGQRDCRARSTASTTTTTTTPSTTTEAQRPAPRCCPAQTVGDDERSEYCCADRPAREYCTEEDGRRICKTF